MLLPTSKTDPIDLKLENDGKGRKLVVGGFTPPSPRGPAPSAELTHYQFTLRSLAYLTLAKYNMNW